MALATPTLAAAVAETADDRLTFETYMAEETCYRRYDIVDGERIYMAAPTGTHQDIVFNIMEGFRAYQRTTRQGWAVIAPYDLLIRRAPLRTRQPDVLLISNERLERAGGRNAVPLSVAPELVVEVLSPSEMPGDRADKIRDYQRIGVLECWVAHPQNTTVEVLRCSTDAVETVAVYGEADTVRSLAFPDLTLSVADVFAG